MLATFRHLYPRMAPTGVYVVEDVGTSYWDEYEGGLKCPGTFIEHVRDLINSLNAADTRGAVLVTDFTVSTFSMAVYDSIIAFERRPKGERHSLITGPMSR